MFIYISNITYIGIHFVSGVITYPRNLVKELSNCSENDGDQAVGTDSAKYKSEGIKLISIATRTVITGTTFSL